MSECYRRTSGCTLPGGHDKSDCGPVQAAAERVQAFLEDVPHDEVLTTGYDDGKVLLTGDLRLLVEAVQ